MSRADRYREAYTSLRDRRRVRAGVYYPEAGILWTAWRERRARDVLEEYKPADDQDEPEDVQKARKQFAQFEEAKAEPYPVVIVAPGNTMQSDVEEQIKAGEISQIEGDTRLLMECARKPRFDESDEMILEGGHPLPGEPLYEKTDKSYLLSDEHLVGGALWTMRHAVATYVSESMLEANRQAGNFASEI